MPPRVLRPPAARRPRPLALRPSTSRATPRRTAPRSRRMSGRHRRPPPQRRGHRRHGIPTDGALAAGRRSTSLKCSRAIRMAVSATWWTTSWRWRVAEKTSRRICNGNPSRTAKRKPRPSGRPVKRGIVGRIDRRTPDLAAADLKAGTACADRAVGVARYRPKISRRLPMCHQKTERRAEVPDLLSVSGDPGGDRTHDPLIKSGENEPVSACCAGVQERSKHAIKAHFHWSDSISISVTASQAVSADLDRICYLGAT